MPSHQKVSLGVREALYTRWRRWSDAFFVGYTLFATGIPASYILLRMSVTKEANGDTMPYHSSITKDPWFSSFPCRDNPESMKDNLAEFLVSPHQWKQLLSPQSQSAECLQWFVLHWWWVTPYIVLLHAFVDYGALFLFGPGVVYIQKCFPGWWSTGGRSLWFIVWRLYRPIMSILQLLLFRDWDSVQIMDANGAATFSAAPLVIRSVVGTVPWQTQRWLVPCEGAAIVLFSLARHRMRPPSRMWLLQLVASVGMGMCMALWISAVECLTLLRVSAEEPVATPHVQEGPARALCELAHSASELLQDVIKFACTPPGALLFLNLLAFLFWDQPMLM